MRLSEEQIGRMGKVIYFHWLDTYRTKLAEGSGKLVSESERKAILNTADESMCDYAEGVLIGLSEIDPDLAKNGTAEAIMEVSTVLRTNCLLRLMDAMRLTSPMPPLDLGPNGELPPFPFPKT